MSTAAKVFNRNSLLAIQKLSSRTKQFFVYYHRAKFLRIDFNFKAGKKIRLTNRN